MLDTHEVEEVPSRVDHCTLVVLEPNIDPLERNLIWRTCNLRPVEKRYSTSAQCRIGACHIRTARHIGILCDCQPLHSH
ncbi:MAG: hypothetical protein EXS17_06005 [Phycisphaerales bacterium]|nr:hypothetical protein [Phycisphaerales bacterium]